MIEDYDKHKEEMQRQAHGRKGKSERQFEEAVEWARKFDLELVKCNDAQYNLWGPNRTWLIQIYPGNSRLYSPPSKRGPYLHGFKGRKWVLMDVVIAAVEEVCEQVYGDKEHYGECVSCETPLAELGGDSGTGLCAVCCQGTANPD